MKQFKYLFLAIILTTIMSSCSSKKNLPKGDATNNISSAIVNSQKSRFDDALKNYNDYNLFQARTKYSFGGKSLSGRFNVEHGKRMKLTATVLGIEVIRIEITTEQVTLVDKMDKLYTVLSIGEFAQKLGMQAEMRYDALECLLMGRMFVPGKGEAKSSDFKSLNWEILPTTDLRGVYTKDKYAINYDIDQNNILKITTVKLENDDKNMTFEYEYSNYQKLGDLQFPGTSSIRINGLEDTIYAEIAMSNPVEGKNWTAFVPSGEYRQVTISELVTAIKNLGK